MNTYDLSKLSGGVGNRTEVNTSTFDSAFSVLMRNVYSWMSLALVVTALSALYVSNSPYVLELLFSNSSSFIILIVAQLGLALAFSFGLQKMSFGVASLLYGLYAILTGVTFSTVFMVYTAGSIASTFFITAGTFGAMSLYGYLTKKDLSKWGQILLMGLLGIIIASVVNLFMHSDTVMWVTTYIGVIVFVGLTAYDTQKIKNLLYESSEQGVNENTLKLSLFGSFMLYLDFINLFLKLIRLLGKRK